ncbi:MAG TPA: polysaccharide ABC transporter ATP-binding protein [Acidimicrobiales bacterium]|nr:polysaccharide ABC transporter ATP-binding protein [Acidimicrobiales bacterium]
MAAPLISLADAGKRYTKFEDAPMLVSAALRFRARTKRSQLWAVRHVDLEVGEGQCVGVIGRNGSGKSTLLQMLAGVTAPTEGRVTVRGKVAPLISVGVGFHPELTGRENVYVNAAILGLRRREVDARLDEIVAFADIAGFVDTPVKFYSSGMFVRLGFAVAVSANPRVLLIDEVLAVGDLAFQMKCFDKMAEIRDSGATVVVVSHNLNAVRRMSDHTMVLHNGVNRFFGATPDAISLYHQLLGEERDPDGDVADPPEPDSEIRGLATVDSWRRLEDDGLGFEAVVSFSAALLSPIFAFSIATERGVMVYGEGVQDPSGRRFEAGDTVTFRVRVADDLAAGSYRAGLAVAESTTRETVASARPVHFYVDRSSAVRGVADLHGSFEFKSP